MKRIISLIVSMDKNRGIGKDNKLPWHISEDLKHFKMITRGHPVIMGRKTFESIGKVLPERINIVVTRNTSYSYDDVIIMHSLEEALSYAKSHDSTEVFIIGGVELYRQGITIADRLYLTVVDEAFEVDTYFPDFSNFKKIISSYKKSSPEYSYTFLTIER